jgi:hypothetical protein
MYACMCTCVYFFSFFSLGFLQAWPDPWVHVFDFETGKEVECLKVTHSIVREHILYEENAFYVFDYETGKEVECLEVTHSIVREHILYEENAFYVF